MANKFAYYHRHVAGFCFDFTIAKNPNSKIVIESKQCTNLWIRFLKYLFSICKYINI